MPEYPTMTKYPRTHHLTWSPGATSDDKVLPSIEHFIGQEVVVTEKLDGENTTIYANGYIHARSLDSKPHKSRDAAYRLAERIGQDGLPDDMRICGENVYAQHAIGYRNLPAYFISFGIYQGDTCLSWDETLDWCHLLGLYHAAVLYRGPWDEAVIRACWTGRSTTSPGDPQEGYVVRLAGAFPLAAFGSSVAKYVRPGHVEEGAVHWMHRPIVPNTLGPRKL
jgi:hypothetical protein